MIGKHNFGEKPKIIMRRGQVVKICRNCGRETEDDKVRCPYCGDLFQEDMDKVLSQMKNNLIAYKGEISAQGGNAASAAVPADPAVQSAPYAPAQSVSAPAPGSQQERFELLAEVAQLKGEVKALHSEVDRMHAAQQAPAQQSAPQVYIQQHPGAQNPYAAQPQTYAYGQPFGTAQPAAAAGQPVAGALPQAKTKKPRSKKRIFISVVAVLLLGLSIGMFFLPWIGTEGLNFKGFDAFGYLFGEKEGTVFAGYLAAIQAKEFQGSEFIANACRNVCYYGTMYGIIAYAAFLVLSLFQLCSLGGRISLKGWHRFTAWMSFILALALFGIFCWVSGFSAVTMWFLLGAGANFVRCLFLAFYGVKKPVPEGYGYIYAR